MNGAQLIAQERRRQVRVEGWKSEHDDLHRRGELGRAARCYARPTVKADSDVPAEWPWETEWWKPSNDKVKNLIRSGALIAAEIDRIRRLPKANQ